MVLLESKMVSLLPIFVLLLATYARAQSFGEAELVYEWDKLDFDWPSEADEERSIENGSYVPERNLIVGIKVYNGDVYVTIPRWFWPNGHPVTLAKVVKVNNETKLRPYPNWAYQKQDNCSSFQFVMSMEIDPNSGLMYVIDTGRVGHDLNLCPAKLYVFDLQNDALVDFYEFPDDVVNRTKNFLNDIVLDYIDGKVRFAYMSDAYDSKIIIYDFQTRSSYFIKDPSMDIVKNESIITFNGKEYDYVKSAVNGIAMSPDFNYVYYCAVSAYSLYQIPTSTLRNVTYEGTNGIRRLGRKVSQTGGIAHGRKNLYYGALGLNAVYFWDSRKDMAAQNVGMDKVILQTQTQLVRNDNTMQWPDTFAFDNQGWLWFTSDRLPLFWDKGIPTETPDGSSFMKVWKVFVHENSYLYEAEERTQEGNGAKATLSVVGVGAILPVLCSLFNNLF